MSEPLRPMSTGELMDRTFALYRKNFVLFVGIAAVGPAANVIFQLLTVGANVGLPFGARRAATSAAALASIGLGMFFGYFILLAGMAISHAATVKAVAAVHLGYETSVGGAYKALRGRILSLFGTVGLIVLWMGLAAFGIMVPIVIIFGIVLAALGVSARGSAAPIFAGIVGVAVVVLVFALIIAVYVRYALAIQACVVEGLGPRASLRRSVLLSKGSRWRVVAIYVVFFLLALILSWALVGLATGAATFIHNRIAAAIPVYLAGFIAGSLTGPLATIGISLLYYDERVRKEAFDLQLMMSSLDPIPPSQPLAAPAQI